MPFPKFGETDFEELLEARVGKERLAGKLDAKDVWKHMDGNILCLSVAADRIEEEVEAAEREGKTFALRIEDLPATTERVFQEAYDHIAERRKAKPSGNGAARARMLEYLCVAREGLSLDDLRGLLAHEGTPLSLLDCRDRLDEMSQYLLDVGGRRYIPWHKGLADHVRERVLGEADARDREKSLVAWLESAAPISGYALRHRVAHLLSLGEARKASDALLDHGFLEAKADAGLVFELAGDFTAATEALPEGSPRRRAMRLINEAFGLDVYFLSRHPSCLFQCLWNRAWWYDAPAAGPYYESNKPPGDDAEPPLHLWMEAWRSRLAKSDPGGLWLRARRPPPTHLGAALRAVFTGHGGGVNAVAFSRDGTRIASGSEDNTVRVWDAASGRELAILRGHEGAVTSVSFSGDGGRVASGSDDTTVRVWDAASGRELAILRGHEDSVWSVSFSVDGGRVASGSDDTTVRVWDAASGACLEVIHGEGDVREIANRHGGASRTGVGAGSHAEAYRAIVRENEKETAIERVADGREVAWFSEAFGGIQASWAGRAWTGTAGNHVYIITLDTYSEVASRGGDKAPG